MIVRCREAYRVMDDNAAKAAARDSDLAILLADATVNSPAPQGEEKNA